MANVDFDIQLFSGEADGAATLYRPGEMVKGQVTIFTDSDINSKEVSARLVWHTEGRGSRFEEKVESKVLQQGTLRASFPNTFDFSFLLPNDPWSYEGYYVSIVWEIEVDINVSWGKDLRGRKQFVMQPVRSAAADPFA